MLRPIRLVSATALQPALLQRLQRYSQLSYLIRGCAGFEGTSDQVTRERTAKVIEIRSGEVLDDTLCLNRTFTGT